MGGVGDALGGVLGKVFGGTDDMSDAIDEQNKLTKIAMDKADKESAKAEKAASEQDAMVAEREAKATAEENERTARSKRGRKDLLFASETGTDDLNPTLGG